MELVRHAFDAWTTEQEDVGTTPDVNTHVFGSPTAVTPAVLTQEEEEEEEEEDMEDNDDMEGQESFLHFSSMGSRNAKAKRKLDL